MFINKTPDGKNNLCGSKIKEKRQEKELSQRELSELLQVEGLDIDKNAVQRIEAGLRFVTDIEIVIIARTLKISIEELLSL